MKIEKVIKMAGLMEPGNVLPEELAIEFLSELDGLIQSDIMLHAPEEIVHYDSKDQELLLRPPHDGLYVSYLVAMIRQCQGEFEGYNNAQAIVNEKLSTFHEWYSHHYRPADTNSRSYTGGTSGDGFGFAYLTAYGLAVKHGYQGTEEEWLQSLKGAKGDAGAAARMRYDAERDMIQWGVGEEWQDLYTMAEVLAPLYEKLDEMAGRAETAAEEAEAARDEAEEARDEVRTSVGAAAASATSAKNYSVTAAQKADAAAESAQLALQSERAAETAADEAKNSAASASGSAADAQTQAETAGNYADHAKNYSVAAAQNADAAEISASQALESKETAEAASTSAGASAEDASNAAGVAGTARDEAEAARDEARQAAEEAKEAAASGGDTGQSVELTDLAGYKLSPGGLVLSAADSETQFVSEPVAVTAGELLMVTASAKYGNSLYALYDSSGAMVANRLAPATEAGEAVEELQLTVPAGAVSMRLSWDKGVSETRYAIVRRASAYAGPLAGVKCAVIGDSVIEAAGAPNAGLVDLMSLATGAEIVNLGVGGTGWMQGQDDGTAYYQRAADIPADVRRVLLYGSGNDRELPLGDPADTGTDTVCGCVNAALDAVYAHVPTAWVGVISPAPWQYFPPYESGNAMELLAQALGAICRRRGVPYLDLYHCSGLRPWDESFRELAYLNADGVHPNAAGYALIAPQCTAFLTGGSGGSGADGATPVKGVDYFTEAEVQEIAGIAAGLVEVPSGGSGITIVEDTLSEAVTTYDRIFTDEEIEMLNTAKRIRISYEIPDREYDLTGVTFGIYRPGWYGYVWVMVSNVTITKSTNDGQFAFCTSEIRDEFSTTVPRKTFEQRAYGISGVSAKNEVDYKSSLEFAKNDSIRLKTTVENGIIAGTVIMVEVLL